MSFSDAILAVRSSRPKASAASPEEDSAAAVVSEFFVTMSAAARRYAFVLVHDEALAEDICQEAFLRLYDSLRQGQQPNQIKPWLFRVIHNLCMDEARRIKGQGQMDTLECAKAMAIPAVESSPEQQAVGHDMEARLELALKRLSSQERHCFELRSEGLRYREIAAILSIQVPTVQTLLGRAIKKLMLAKG